MFYNDALASGFKLQLMVPIYKIFQILDNKLNTSAEVKKTMLRQDNFSFSKAMNFGLEEEQEIAFSA